jgi:predicted ATPase/DNA-binding XRE family transcriptional regulator
VVERGRGDDRDDDLIVSFGAWVARRRRALQLTQRQLALRVSCSHELIRKIEGDARRPSRAIAITLAHKLELDGEAADLFVQAARAERPVAQLPAPERRGSTADQPHRELPTPTTRLIGREDDLAMLRELVVDRHARLITLVGPGGVGKTRLALAVGAAVAPSFEGDVCFVPLAPVRGSALVPAAVAHALGIQRYGEHTASAVVDAVRWRRCLLVLDNFEHVLEAATLVSDLITGAPEVTVLVTSRERLNVTGERVFRVAPLALPEAHAGPDACPLLRASAAVQLFAERAAAIQSHFTLDDTNAAAVGRLCTLLDGLPLAIELAAARCQIFSPPELLARLEAQRSAQLALLRGGTRDAHHHQRSLADTLAWSYALLTPAEQRFFDRLGVFTGGWDLDAAAAMAEPGEEVAELLGSLVDKSLVNVEAVGPHARRFSLLETTRAFATEQLITRGELQLMQERHLQHFLQQAQRVRVRHTEDGEVAYRTTRDHVIHNIDNYREAIVYALDHPGQRLQAFVELLTALRRTTMRVYANELSSWKERALRRLTEAPALARADTLLELSFWLDGAEAVALAQSSLVIFEQLGQHARVAGVYYRLWEAYHVQGEPARATDTLHALVDRCRRVGDMSALANSLFCLGMHLRDRGDTAEAARIYGEAWEIAHDHRLDNRGAMVLQGIGDTRWDSGDVEGAIAAYHAAMTLAKTGTPSYAWAHLHLGSILTRRGDLRAARRHVRYALALFTRDLDGNSLGWSLFESGRLAYREGQLQRAAHDYAQALAMLLRYEPERMAVTVEGLAAVALDVGHPAVAVRLLGGAMRLRNHWQFPVWPCDREDYEQLVNRAHHVLGAADYARIYNEGYGLPPEATVVTALEVFAWADTATSRQGSDRARPTTSGGPGNPQ